nr:MAG TPA: hypothetical protein [Caudoviricetes sp.]
MYKYNIAHKTPTNQAKISKKAAQTRPQKIILKKSKKVLDK